MPKHFAIPSSSLKNTTIAQLDLDEISGDNALVFSHDVLQNFIREERRHETTFLDEQNARSLQQYSSGEQKKALLKYLLAQRPKYLILDNPFDALDKASVARLKDEFFALKEDIQFVQIFRRKDEILSFIYTVIVFAHGEKKSYTTNEFLQEPEHESTFGDIQIPEPYEAIEDVPEVLFEMKNVSVSYDRPILNNISWQVKKGEFWQLMGPNGSGKTTILDMLFGNNVKGYGQELYLFGKKKGSGESVWEIKKKIGYYSPAMTSMFDTSNTAREMILSGFFDSVGLYEQPRLAQKKIADQWLEIIDLKNDKRTFNTLTATQRCLTLIARAMVKHPPLLILDEPTAALDDEGARLVAFLINKIAAETQTTILYVCHRDEPGLEPQLILKLTPDSDGSKAEKKSM